MLVSESITKIRRLVGDVNREVFPDQQIINIFAREEQVFCRDTGCVFDIYLLKAPPRLDYAACFAFEEAQLAGSRVFRPFYETHGTVATQPWELEESYESVSSGDYTVTSGADLHSVDPENLVPFFFTPNTYSVKGMVWDNKEVVYKSFDFIDRGTVEGWLQVSDVVDYWTYAKALRKKAFYTKGIPTDEQSSGSDQESQIDKALLEDVFYVFATIVPNRVSANSDAITVQKPFVKYVEFAVAARLLESDTEKYSPELATHYRLRADIGKKLVKRITEKAVAERTRKFGRLGYGQYTRLGRPRLPDHYPRLF